MYQLLRTPEGELRYKREDQGSPQPRSNAMSDPLPPRVPTAVRQGVHGFETWVQRHHRFIDWVVDRFVEHVMSVNEGVNKVSVDTERLTSMMERRLYASSYNKERGYV